MDSVVFFVSFSVFLLSSLTGFSIYRKTGLYFVRMFSDVFVDLCEMGIKCI